MQIQENISLKEYNSFGIGVSAKYFSEFSGHEELAELLDWSKQHKGHLILGGGSNILLTRDIDGVVLKNNIRGFGITGEDESHVYVTAGAGENWHTMVMRCIEHSWAGLENLALIPGNTGASPMQNIGAYGVEIKDVFHELNAWDKEDNKLVKFNTADCEFGYRESVFKGKYRDRFVILSVGFRLNKQPEFHISYGAIREELERMNVDQLSIRSVAEAVIRIRSSKLPDPAIIGNAGSFFKNPEVTPGKFEQLRETHPDIVGYPLPSGTVKLAAGWLIEKAGWKGYREGDAGCHERQALVLVNFGNAGGSDILRLSEKIRSDIAEKFGVTLIPEVNVI